MRIPMLIVMFLFPLMLLAGEQEATLNVAGNCTQCKKRIVDAAKSVDGVSDAKWDKRKKILVVEFDDTKASVESITKAVLKVGHDVEDKKAESAAYKTLPECCLYRETEH